MITVFAGNGFKPFPALGYGIDLGNQGFPISRQTESLIIQDTISVIISLIGLMFLISALT